MAKKNHICKWISSFVISTFVIMEEKPSGQSSSTSHNLTFCFIKFVFSKKATKIDEILPSICHLLHSVKSTMKISSIFLAFLENMNFKRSLRRTLLTELWWLSILSKMAFPSCPDHLEKKKKPFLNVQICLDFFLFLFFPAPWLLQFIRILRRNAKTHQHFANWVEIQGRRKV